MKNVINLSVKKPIGTLMLFISISFIGLLCIGKSNIDFLPKIEIPKITVITNYSGLPAKEINDMITIPLEDILSSQKGLKDIYSISKDGASIIELEFHFGTKLNTISVEIRELLDIAYLSLPEGCQKPNILPISTNDKALFTIAVSSKNGDLSNVRLLCSKEIKTSLQQINGVSDVKIAGGNIDEVHIDLDPIKLNSLNISVSNVAQYLSSSCQEQAAGYITQNKKDYIIKTNGKLNSIEDLKKFTIPINNGVNVISLDSIANINYSVKERESFFCINNEEAVVMYIRKQQNASPIVVSNLIKKELLELEKIYQSNLKFETIEDNSIEIVDSIKNIIYSGILGGAIAFIVLFIFIKDFYLTLISVISIPFSIILSILLIYIFNRTINIMTLSGLSMGIGMLVDNSIIVIEELNRQKPISKFEIASTVCCVSNSVFGSTFTSILVFLPLVLISGILGSLFLDLALAVIFSLLSSLLSALFLIPCLYSIKRNKHFSISLSSSLEKRYIKFYKYYLRNSKISIVFIIIISILGSIILITRPKEFMKKTNGKTIEIAIQFPIGTTLEEIQNNSYDIYKKLKSINCKNIVIKGGGESDDIYYVASLENSKEILNISIYYNELKDINKEIENIYSLLNSKTLQITISPKQDLLSGFFNIKENNKEYFILENKKSTLEKKIKQIKELNTGGITFSSDKTKSAYKLIPDRYKIIKSGQNLKSISIIINSALRGVIPFTMQFDGNDIDVLVRQSKTNNTSLKVLDSINISKKESPINASNVFTSEEILYSEKIIRKSRLYAEIIYIENDKNSEILAALKNFDLIDKSSNIFIDNKNELILLLFLALICIYFCLGIQFESFTLPIILLLTFPFGFAGSGLLLFITKTNLDLNSALGLLVVMGNSVNNSIILYEVSNQLFSKNIYSSINIIFRSGIIKIRTIAISMLTTVFALIPLAIDIKNVTTQSTLAISIIGGISFSTIFSLLVIPSILYYYWEKRKNEK